MATHHPSPGTHPDAFADRHIGPRPEERRRMLDAIGADSLDALMSETLPDDIRLEAPPALPRPLGEAELLDHLRDLAGRNTVAKSYIGLGYHPTVTPAVIRRNVLENPGWYTQYTPYQAEIAQGRLEALLNFQTAVADLTGLPISGASLLDEATAAAEAMLMFFHAVNKRQVTRPVFWVADDVLPQTLAVLQTRAEPQGIELRVAAPEAILPDHTAFGALLQYPGQDGALRDPAPVIERVHAAGGLAVLACDLLGLALLRSPGALGADAAVGSAQRFGVPMGYGGPHAAFFATREDFKRQIPGRIIGVSVDRLGNPALRMALQTREQHIRREKATSNICTAQALLAVMAGFYAVYHGPEGIRGIAGFVHEQAVRLDAALTAMGYRQRNAAYFDTLRIGPGQAGHDLARVAEAAARSGINFRWHDNGDLGISLHEAVTETDLRAIVDLFHASRETDRAGLPADPSRRIPADLQRAEPFLTHPVFSAYRSETDMMRYIKKLENKDLSLVHSMIPLGSCTMKLNAAVQLEPVSWPGFGGLHPFAPAEQAEGYRELVANLERYLCAITGFEAVSLQPNSGAQGEYTGLMVIRAYHLDRGDADRKVVLIPASAHGTNPASAVVAGMEVVVTGTDDKGNIDLDDLQAKIDAHADRLAGLMVTYPSTHGVYEETIRDICARIHAAGGLVYMDGANMNAQVGLTSPARIGADVCHLNLHKTFAIPHGGGGPGMGPIGVNAKLAPYLPGHPLVPTGGEKGIGPVSAAPFGSASILLISYAYIRLLGTEGVTDASRVAILNANYLAARLEAHYPILYTGARGRAAHEFILDLRPFKAAGIEVEDVAKRLMDYGFHAPTVSFPVPGTMMIEPTESESMAELDRFVEALVAIRDEIRSVAEGRADAADNPLKMAPHTMAEVTADAWHHPYGRETAAFPLPWVREHKFWASVARVDQPYGDRHLVCTCPPTDTYAEVAAAEVTG
jgi:glycine dehydrogenase